MIPHPLLGLALRLHARGLKPADRDKVKAALRLHNRNRLFHDIEDLAGDKMDPADLETIAAQEPGARGDGTILKLLLDFLDKHWADIFGLILKLLGG